jgi:hypothetical protein
MNKRNSFKDAWSGLVSGAETGAIPIVVSNKKFWIGFDIGANGAKLPFLAIADITFQKFEFSGIEIKTEAGRFGRSDGMTSFLFVKCRSEILLPVFERFVDQVFELIECGDPVQKALQSALDSWLEFLRDLEPNPLSTNEEIGLWAELYVIRSQLANHKSVLVESWRGPEGADWDFFFEESFLGIRELEVKSTTSSELVFTISNERQLQAGTGRWLALFKIREEEALGLSIAQLVAEILDASFMKELGSYKMRTAFLKRLFAAKFRFHSNFQYRRFVNEGVSWFQIDQNFPIIDLNLLPQNIRERVSSVSYCLNLTGIKKSSAPIVI